MKRKVPAMILAACLAAAVFSGCSGNAAQNKSAAQENQAEKILKEEASEIMYMTEGDEVETVRICVILASLSSEYWGLMQAGCNGFEEDYPNAEIEVLGPSSESDYAEQKEIIDAVIASNGYDAIVIAALDSAAAEAALNGIDIPVVSVDRRLNCPESRCFIGTDNENAAHNGALKAVEIAGNRGWDEIKAVDISGIKGVEVHDQRIAGFAKGTEEGGGTFLYEAQQYGDSSMDKASSCMEAIMNKYPEGIAIVYCNNDDMAMAAALAAKGNPAYEKTVFCGFDGISSACKAIMEDRETMSVAQDPYEMGYMACDSAYELIMGNKVESYINPGPNIITKENAEAHYNYIKICLEK